MGDSRLKEFLYVYSTVHRKSMKFYIFSLVTLPLFIMLAIGYISLLSQLLPEGLTFYLLSVLGFPMIITLTLVYVNHLVAKKYKKTYPNTRKSYFTLLFASHSLTYIFVFSFIFAFGTIINLAI
jgi:hypothetical protein